MANWHIFDNRDAQARALAAWTLTMTQDALSESESLRLILPGGNTPRLFFAQMAKQAMPWASISLSVTDERRVPSTHLLRNEYQLDRDLLARLEKKPRLEPMLDETGTKIIERQTMQPDVVVLGMGGDGHVASLFPGSAALGKASQSQPALLEITDAPDLIPRVSRNFSALTGSKANALLICGLEKKALLEVSGKQNAEMLPVHRLLNDQLQIFWAP